jgi:hypothetical protein
VPTFDCPPIHTAPRTADAEAWEVLERFGFALRHETEREQMRLTLEAVQEVLEADAVFWQPDDPAGHVELAGSTPLSAAWCRDFTARAVAEAPDGAGTLLCSFLDPGARPLSPWPCSAALVRLGRSGGAWLGALSFHPRRLFRAADLQVLRLLRRLLLNHRLCALRYRGWKESLADLADSLNAALAQVADARLRGEFCACRQKLDVLRQQGGID